MRRDVLRLDNSDGTLLVFICRAMEDWLRTNLFTTIQLALADTVALMDINTAEEHMEFFSYLVWHFSVYNRHATNVCIS